MTFQFSLSQDNIASGAEAYGQTTLSQWFTGAPEVEMKEDIVGLGSYGKTLTVLYTTETLVVNHSDYDESIGAL